ncbi:hypothetical protein AGRI_06720 [Alishewanella agri BL06]|uniref:Uncharacterized protein n=1 Tax=Alishewanella agri BL06 TaxID=1195246 RepID=I9P301_9ALTE|nr:hypothetical protein [Alishewanella agri]EIW89159.1 hypothetical protein AGRI_06720 [Alishewanella agri BL06]
MSISLFIFVRRIPEKGLKRIIRFATEQYRLIICSKKKKGQAFRQVFSRKAATFFSISGHALNLSGSKGSGGSAASDQPLIFHDKQQNVN